MRWIIGTILTAALIGLGWMVVSRLTASNPPQSTLGDRRPAAVAVGLFEQGRIELRRVYSGTLEARAQFMVAPKVGGRIEKLTVDLADTVTRGQVVAVLDDAEFVLAVEQSQADLAVAEANIVEAKNALEIAERELERVTSLNHRGVASESQLDAAKADQLAKAAAVHVAKAQGERARAALESTKIRLGYTRVIANWSDPDTERIVAERFVDAGETVTANAPLIRIVDLHPINGVIFATENDYARLRIDQPVTLTTDAYPDRIFSGKIRRIAPVFRETSRQARIELEIDNEDHALKPGMFTRAEITLDVAEDATIVPVDALVIRDNENGVFVVNEDGRTVTWRPVKTGIRDANRLQVSGEGLRGHVVTLGQQLISGGSEVTIPQTSKEAITGKEAGDAKAQSPENPGNPEHVQ
ncbi:MAG: efflux RND transporter periplasmic adaptor subunit [Planctomycetota bacterium]